MKWSPYVPAFITAGSLTLAFVTWTTLAAGHISWPLVLASLFLWGLATWLGVCVSHLMAKDGPIDPLIACVLGFYCVTVVLFVGTVVLRLDILVSLAACVGLLGLLAYKTRNQRPLGRLKLEPIGVFALVVAILFATLWSRQNLAGIVLTATTATSTPWLDVFYHAVHITHFARGAGKLLGVDPLLATASLPPYHYAAYLIPSLLVRATGIPSYIASVALLAPLGTLLTGLAAYSFGRIVLGPLAGLLAVVFCLAIPDPTFYLLENRWMSYFFFQQIAGSGAFGVALLLMAWAFCIEGVAKQLRRYTLLGLAAGLCVALFKSQIFLAYAFGLLLFAAATFPRVVLRLRIVLGLVASGLFAVCLFIVLPAMRRAPTFWPGTGGGLKNLHWTLSKVGGACQNCVSELGKNQALYLTVAVPLFLALAFGILVPLCLALARARPIRQSLRPGSLWFFWTALIGYLVVTLGFGPNTGYGDPYEIIHKTFIWPYLAISAWCGCGLAAWLLARSDRLQRLAVTVVLPLALAGLGLTVNACANRLQTKFVYQGSESATHIVLPRAAFDTAEFVRAKTPIGAKVQSGVVDGNFMFQSLMERRGYVVYRGSGWHEPPAAAPARAIVAAMLSAPTAEEFRKQARACGIDYFVLCPGQSPAWAGALQPIFQNGEYRVYRV